MVVPLVQDPAFEHHFGQFLNEQWNTVRARENLVRHLLGQRLAAGDPLDYRRTAGSAKPR
jgi:hypothetical protein